MAKLSDTAATILATAAAREDRAVFPLTKLRAPAVVVRKSLQQLMANGSIEEVRAKRGDEVWEPSQGVEGKTLLITAAGLAAIGITDAALDVATFPNSAMIWLATRSLKHGVYSVDTINSHAAAKALLQLANATLGS